MSFQAFDPEILEYQHTEPTEAALIERIEMRRVTHAIEIYKRMQQLGKFIFTLNSSLMVNLITISTRKKKKKKKKKKNTRPDSAFCSI